MRHVLLSLLSLSLIASEAKLEAPLRRVRIYPDQAWLTREGTHRFSEAGACRMRIEGLPAGLDLDNLRVQADGITGLHLGNVSVVQAESTFKPDAAYLKQGEELRALWAQISDLRLRLAATEEALKTLESLHPMKSGAAPLNPLGIAELGRTLQARQVTLIKQGLALASECQALETKADHLKRAMANREAHAHHRSSTVLIELDAPQAGLAHITLETRTQEARWKPTYEMRLAEDGHTLELLCYAAVSQASGETWNDIRLEISNAQPSLNLHLPSPSAPLQVLYQAPGILSPGALQGRVMDRYGRPVANLTLTATCEALKVTRTVNTDANGVFRMPFLPAGSYRLRGTKSGFPEIVQFVQLSSGKTETVGLRLGENQASASAVVEVTASVASVDATSMSCATTFSQDLINTLPSSRFLNERNPSSETDPEESPLALDPPVRHFEEAGDLGRAWALEGARSLPSDARPHRVLLSRSVLEAGAVLRAFPRASTEVFSMVTVTPSAGFPWFQHTPVTIFRGGERLGQVSLPAIEAGEPVAFSLGPVAGLRVQRKRVESKVIGAKAGKGRQWTLRDRVTFTNELNQEVKVEMIEPALHTTTEKVRVDVLPDPTHGAERNHRGEMVWSLVLPGEAQIKVEEGWRILGPGVGFIPELPALGLPTTD